MRILTCENLCASYGANLVLKNLSFFAEDGECLSILGENGAGKSTLLKCLLGLKKPDSGFIRTEGYSLDSIGYLPQQTQVRRDFPASVFEVVLSGCLGMRGAKPFYSKREKEIACSNLEKMEILNLKKESFCALSGGQQQRVLLARALCSAKKLLILDEPVAGLDPAATKDMYALIETLKQEYNMGIIMVSHDTSGALSVSDRVLHLTCSAENYFFKTKTNYLKNNSSNGLTEAKNV